MHYLLRIGLFLFWFTAAFPNTAICQKTNVPLVLVSIPPQAELVERLAGDAVRVQIMLPAGSNHEAYDPTMGQLTAMSHAALYIKLGHPKFLFEANLVDKMLAAQSTTRVVNASKNIELDEYDIHYWTSPKRLRQSVPTIAAALTALLPERKAELEAKERELGATLEKLDTELREKFLPWRGATFLVFHPSWSYFARDYQLNQLAIEQDGREPGIAQLQRIVEKARALKIRTVFVEPGMPRESVSYITEALGAKSVVLDPVEPSWIANLRFAATAFVQSFEEAAGK